MAQYTAIFTKPYADGYENLPSQNTPITAQTLNDKDDALEHIEDYLSTNDIPSDAEGLSYDNTDSGLTADNVQSAINELNDEKVGKGDTEVKTDSTGQFTTTTGGLLESCVVTLEPVQSGSGTPSPDNVRPITGHSSVEVDVTDADNNTTQYTISLGQTVYGGTLDVVSGMLTIDRASYTFDGTETWNDFASSGSIAYAVSAMKAGLATELNPYSKCSSMEISDTNVQGKCMFGGTSNRYKSFWILGAVGMGLDTKAKVQAYTTGMQIEYVLETPITVQLTPQQIETLIGQNNVSVPLTGQSLDELTYREVMAWDDVEKAVNVKLDLSSVAPIEYTDNASQSYNQKQLFIKDNKLCQALASISSGASFTENTNFKYTTLAEIIEPLIP